MIRCIDLIQFHYIGDLKVVKTALDLERIKGSFSCADAQDTSKF